MMVSVVSAIVTNQGNFKLDVTDKMELSLYDAKCSLQFMSHVSFLLRKTSRRHLSAVFFENKHLDGG